MTETFKQDINDIIEYYNARADMFCFLEDAIDWFEQGHNEDRMWRSLFEHQLMKDATKEMFDAFSYDTLSLLVGAFGVKLVIVGTPDE
jgi:hypothetical protein